MHRIFVLILLYVFANSALADVATADTPVQITPATQALRAAMSGIESLQGSFTQKQYSQEGELLEQSSGRFALLRPGFFRWEITHPDDQLLVADPHYLWHHDRDLETVTRRPASDSGQMAPFKILGGNYEAVEETFEVRHGENQGQDFVFIPLEEGAGFVSLALTLHQGALSRMTILDELDQTVSIEFFELDQATALTPADFLFTPPEGADLFYYDQ